MALWRTSPPMCNFVAGQTLQCRPSGYSPDTSACQAATFVRRRWTAFYLSRQAASSRVWRPTHTCCALNNNARRAHFWRCRDSCLLRAGGSNRLLLSPSLRAVAACERWWLLGSLPAWQALRKKQAWRERRCAALRLGEHPSLSPLCWRNRQTGMSRREQT